MFNIQAAKQKIIDCHCHASTNKGVALVVTIAIVSILATAALQLSKFTGDSVAVTIKGKNMFQAEQYAIAGIELARLILAADASRNSIDSLQEPWADPAMLSKAVNEMGLDNNRLTIKITDELSKIQVNALLLEFPGNQLNSEQAEIWERFFYPLLSLSNNENPESKDLTENKDPIAIINCVKDWLDSLDDDAVSGLSGAESDYYLGLTPSYSCANAPFNHIDELTSVKGISKELLKNYEEEGSDNNNDDDNNNGVEENNFSAVDNFPNTEDQTQKSEFKDFFTVYGLDHEKLDNSKFRYKGKININTAGVDVLKALLPSGMDTFAQDLADFRLQQGELDESFINELDKGWYNQVIFLSEKEQEKFERTISYSSNIFKVECTGMENNSKVKLAAWVKREKLKKSGQWICKIIQMER